MVTSYFVDRNIFINPKKKKKKKKKIGTYSKTLFLRKKITNLFIPHLNKVIINIDLINISRYIIRSL